MKNNPHRFAFLGLILSGLGLLTLLGVLLLQAFSKLGIFSLKDPDLFSRILFVAIGVIIIGFAIYSILAPDNVRKFLTGRQARQGSNSLILFIAFTGILVVLNVMAFQYPKSWDVTADKHNTLAPETIQTLQSLPEPVTATGFYSSRLNTGAAQDLLEQYKTNSNGNFSYQFVDPETNPVLVKQLGITGDGKILLQMGQQQEIVTLASETELTSGLVRLLNPNQPVIYFTTGDGEHDTEASADDSYSRARQVLENKNYVVKTLNLKAENTIPNDAHIIVVAGPLAPLTEGSVSLLKDFVDNGGSLLVLANPTPLTQFGDKPDLLAEYLASDWGISLDNDIVIDTNSPSTPFFAVGATYSQHPITEKMQGVAAIFPLSRSLTLNSDNTKGVSANPLVYTIDASWGETNFASIEQQQWQFNQGEDFPGPMLLAAAANNSATKSRVVVIGSSTFAQDSNFDFSGNGDMLINTIDWLAEQDTLIGLTTNQTTTRTIDFIKTPQLIAIMVSSSCLIPLIIIIAGVYSWVMRRRRG